MKKKRFVVDLDQDLKEWAEKTALQLSVDRGERVSRNQVIAEALILYRDKLEGKKEDT